jgi:putative transposase
VQTNYTACMILTYRYRIKDATTGKHLNALSRAVNRVWNYCGEIHEASRRHNKRWPSAFDMIKLTTGSSAMLGLHSDTVQAVCKQFVSSRDLHRRRPRWRGKKSLGWVPFAAARAIKMDGDAVIHLKRRYRLWLSRPVDPAAINAGSFSQDARGRWYLNLQVEVAEAPNCGVGEVAIDLGLKTLGALSDGRKIANLRHYRKYERALAKAQRARNKGRAKAIHAKVVNARRHHLHEQSTKLVRENSLIVVGDVDAGKLTQTRMAKSVLDASWSGFRSMLRYKAMRHGARYIEADERGSSVTCSACGARSGPKGIAGLRVREWVCDGCGVLHDRDHNAALNLLLGAERRPLVAEIPAL